MDARRRSLSPTPPASRLYPVVGPFLASRFRRLQHNTLLSSTRCEVACIKKFWELPEEGRPLPSECLMLATHEPCSMCTSAITWSGFHVSGGGCARVCLRMSASACCVFLCTVVMLQVPRSRTALYLWDGCKGFRTSAVEADNKRTVLL